MVNSFQSALVVLVLASGLLLWGSALPPDEGVAREYVVSPALARGLGVIGVIGSMVLFLLDAARLGRVRTPHEEQPGQGK
ncbi:MAG: hypothetical protein HOP18_12970 [Deltaproteobacteria bacterium]|nr:hypothetical protein [Deltaproteobacteria bacterium]